jgi:HK97 family phage portal protein
VSLFFVALEENLSFWSNLWSLLGGTASQRVIGVQTSEPGSGRLTKRSVTPDTALQISSVFACVRILAETVAGLPLNFYERAAGGALNQIFEHPLYQILNTKPNRYQTNVEFFETLMYQYALHGNSYHRIDRNKKGEVISLMPYMTHQVETMLQEDGNILHKYNTGRKIEEITEDNMWHNKLFGNGVIGMSPLGYARNSIGVQISAEDRVNSMANNNFKQSGVLMIDKVLKPEQRKQIRENFRDLTEGGDDALKILEAGAQYQSTSMNPRDVQFLETRRFQTEDIARFFNVPSVLINDTNATTVWGSGIEQIVTGFYKLGLRPYLERIEASVKNRLLQISERRNIVPAFEFDMLLAGSEKTRYEAYKTGIAGGVLTINEARKKEELPPIKGGDDLRIQQQVVPVGQNKGGLNA